MVKSIINLVKTLKNSLNPKPNSITITETSMKSREDKIYEVAKELCVANNTCSTLEIKNELRKKYPNEAWFQSEVSDVMRDFYDKGKFFYQDNGTFRTYSLANTQTNTTSPGATTTTISVSATKTPKLSKPTPKKGGSISRTKAMDLIQNSKGRFFTVVFDKKDGSERKLVGQYSKNMSLSPLGYINVRDTVATRAKANSTIKSVNLQTIKEIKINNTVYKVS
jgi:hypothetical protein